MPSPRSPPLFPFSLFLATMLRHATSMLHLTYNLYYKKSTRFKKGKRKNKKGLSLVQSGRGGLLMHYTHPSPIEKKKKKKKNITQRF